MKTVNPVSDVDVTARGLSGSLVVTAEEDASSESDSGTGSKCSFFRAQEQRPPWPQQQSSAILGIRNCCCHTSKNQESSP